MAGVLHEKDAHPRRWTGEAVEVCQSRVRCAEGCASGPQVVRATQYRTEESGYVATPRKSEAAASTAGHHDSLCAGGPLHRRAGGVLVRPVHGRVNVCCWATSDAERGSTWGVTPPRPLGCRLSCGLVSRGLRQPVGSQKLVFGPHGFEVLGGG